MGDPDLQAFLSPTASRPAPLLVTLDAPRKSKNGGFEYPMTVSNQHLGARHKLEWSLTKRHEEFVAFDSRMRVRFPDKDLPVFPRKRRVTHLLRYGSDDEWFKVQGMEIESYLNAILSADKLQESSMLEDACVRELLGINESKLRIAMRTARAPTSHASASSSNVELEEEGGAAASSAAASGRALLYTPSSASASTSNTAMAAAALNNAASRSPGQLAMEPVRRPQEDQSCGHVRSRLQSCLSFFTQAIRPPNQQQAPMLGS